jgi:FkbM family methyltransferase
MILLYIQTPIFFYKKGWNGICIEPNPEAAEKLKINRPNDIVLNTAISNHRSTVKFVLSKACSGILDENYTFKNSKHEKVIDVHCLPLSDIIEQYAKNRDIEFLSIDCEGHDLTILQTADWNKARPKIVLVEDHNITYDGPIYEFMKSNRYSYLCKIGPTIFFREESFVLRVH